MGDRSAFAALGLEPGADAAAIDRAYKRLIKQHHPDRAGGDARRAAELNRAYRELRGARAKEALEFNDDPGFERQRRGRWVAMIVVMAGAVIAGLLVSRPLEAPPIPLGQVAAAASPSDPMDEPLSVEAVNEAVREARYIARTKDEMGLAAASQACHHKLRTAPSLVQLDRCAAFDDAVVELQDRDPLRDRGPFSELAVTGRQWSGASALSSDYLAIDGRLDRIRLHVELALAPPLPAEAVAKVN